ncbi:MAG: PRC-barrel domain-containing protein [Candidatus Promineifilaceae bacterium]|nr:PRC-barrel domain-containing protein [Candidatus Promineifilaceae bacterium]
MKPRWKNSWKRLLIIVLALTLATTVLVACDTDDDVDVADDELIEDEGLLDEDDVLDEDPLTDEGLFGEFDLDDDLLLTESEFEAFLIENDFGGDTALAFEEADLDDDLLIDETEFDTFLETNEFDPVTGFPAFEEEVVDEDVLEEDVVEDPGVDETLFGEADVDDDLFLTESEFETFLVDNDFAGDAALAFEEADLDDDTLVDETEFDTFLETNEFDPVTGFPAVAEDDDLLDDEVDVDDETAAETLADAPGFVTADTYVGMTLVTPLDVEIGEIVDGFFDMNGDIQYLAVDVDEEAVVELETVLGDEELFDTEVDVILISQNLISVQATADRFATDFGTLDDAEMAQMMIETPARLVLLDDAPGTDIPWLAQEIDAAALEAGESFFVETADFDLDATAADQDLLQITLFEFWEGTDNAVETLAGEELGDIDELIIDFVNGRVAYVTVDTGGFLGLDGTNNAVIPWSALSYRPDGNDFVLEVDPVLIETAPVLADEDLDAGFFDRTFFDEEVDPFFDDEI